MQNRITTAHTCNIPHICICNIHKCTQTYTHTYITCSNSITRVTSSVLSKSSISLMIFGWLTLLMIFSSFSTMSSLPKTFALLMIFNAHSFPVIRCVAALITANRPSPRVLPFTYKLSRLRGLSASVSELMVCWELASSQSNTCSAVAVTNMCAIMTLLKFCLIEYVKMCLSYASHKREQIQEICYQYNCNIT